MKISHLKQTWRLSHIIRKTFRRWVYFDNARFEEEITRLLGSWWKIVPPHQVRDPFFTPLTNAGEHLERAARWSRALGLQFNLLVCVRSFLVPQYTERSGELREDLWYVSEKEFAGKIPISGLFHTWCIDFARPLPRTNVEHPYLVVAFEQMSK